MLRDDKVAEVPGIGRGPLVSIGVPVRNGGPELWGALCTLTSQTHTNLEIIISDNASTDETEQIARRFAVVDRRVRFMRQPDPISAIENFKAVLQASSGEYFMWAAHDDRRSENYVEILLKGFDNNRKATLIFSDLICFHDFADIVGQAQKSALESEGLSARERIKSCPLSACTEFYGLHRSAVAKDYEWQDIDFSPDVPFLVYESLRGDFVYQPGAAFYQWLPVTRKSPTARAKENALRDLGSFRVVRLSLAIGRAATQARVGSGQQQHPLRDFLTSYWSLRTSLTRTWLFEHSPRSLQNAWRRLKYGGKTQAQIPATADLDQPGNRRSLPK